MNGRESREPWEVAFHLEWGQSEAVSAQLNALSSAQGPFGSCVRIISGDPRALRPQVRSPLLLGLSEVTEEVDSAGLLLRIDLGEDGARPYSNEVGLLKSLNEG